MFMIFSGREYDEKGNLNHWWNNKTIENFKQQTQCIVDQYSKFQLDGLNLNGKQTLGKISLELLAICAHIILLNHQEKISPTMVA